MQQIAFAFNDYNNFYNLNEYITSSSNSLAYRTIINWPINWGVVPYTKTLILKGARSSGKTFLAKKWASKTKALFVTPQSRLTDRVLSYYQAFIIDGFDNSWSEEHFLHYFNWIHENNKFLLITITHTPHIHLPDLDSRIKASNIVNINTPDDELIKMLIFKLFSNYSVSINFTVINYLIKVLPRDCLQIEQSVKRINYYALQRKSKVTIPLIKQVLYNQSIV
jgi:chromosomal replication initiation ATPase DnaA